MTEPDDIRASVRTLEGVFDVSRRGGKWICSGCGRGGCIHTDVVRVEIERTTTGEQSRSSKADQDKRRHGSGVTEAMSSEYQPSAANSDYLVSSVMHRSVITSGVVTVTAEQWQQAMGYDATTRQYRRNDDGAN